MSNLVQFLLWKLQYDLILAASIGLAIGIELVVVNTFAQFKEKKDVPSYHRHPRND